MKNVTLKNVINFIITVLTAIASAFCVSSCRG
ncbi:MULTISPECIES: smalltalk protein [Prevotellaceae]|nr:MULTISPECIES: smalltalk protein [Prevotellaceae]